MKHTAVSIAVGTMATLLLAGCDIDKTEDGELPDVDASYTDGQLPKYEVEVRQTQEGKLPDVDVDVDAGKLPSYEIETADVNIGSKDVDVKVPDVDVSMEEKTVTVPDIDIDMPEDDEEEEQSE